MEIKEMQQLRASLEAKLKNAAAEVVDEFQRRTGVYVVCVSPPTVCIDYETMIHADKCRSVVLS